MKKFFVSLLTIIGAVCASLALSACSCSCSCNPKKVEDNTVNDITLTDKEITVFVGGTYKFTPGGAEKFTYSSSDPTVASVDKNGVLTGRADGTAFINVGAENAEAVCRVNVVKDENYIRLNVTSATAFVGGEVTIKAEVIRNGEVSDEKVFFGTDSDGMRIKSDGVNSVAVTCDETGYYTLKANRGGLMAECIIKAVNLNAETLALPEVATEDCKTVSWQPVENATGYEYCINGGEWVKTTQTYFNAESVTDGLKFGDKAIFAVKATAEGDFDHIDGLATVTEFSHDYKQTVISEYTCVKAGKVLFDCEVCKKSYTDENFLADHVYKDGWCEVCHTQLTPKVVYRYDESNDCYFVVGADAGYDAENLYILAKYNDGKNGERPVKYIGYGAFQSNKTIKKVIIPESITEFVDKNDVYNVIYKDGTRVSSPLRGMVFDDCSNLEYISMRGITVFRDIAGYVIVNENGEFTRVGEASEDDVKNGLKSQPISFAHWNFRDCYSLEKIIVGEGFDNYGATFMRWYNTPDAEERKADLYVYGASIIGFCNDSYTLNAVMSPGNNALLTGDVFYYDETSTDCYKWHFAEDGETIVTSGKHEYNAKNVCKKCGAYNDYGVKYGYDENSDVYYVDDNSGTIQTEITVISTYNDGKHGVHPVTYARNGAFKGNGSITKVTLPESVVRLEGGVFERCKNLEYVSMAGVEDLSVYAIKGGIYGETVDTGNNFLDCYKLKTLIVNKNLNLVGQQFLGRPVDGVAATASIDLYSNGSAEESNIQAAPNAQNNLLTGVIYYFGKLDVCRRWTIEDGDIETSAREHDYNEKGVCVNCGEYKTDGVTFGYYTKENGEGVYFVTGYTGSGETVNVPGAYNDGVHGVKKVEFVASGAFRGNAKIKKVILPESVVSLEGNVFWGCENLEYVSMTGVKNLDYASPYGGEGRNNNFRDCFKLKVVITSTALTSNVGQFGTAVGNTPENPVLDFYVYGESGAPALNNGAADADNLVSGRVYYYSETSAENCWHYDENGNAVLW